MKSGNLLQLNKFVNRFAWNWLVKWNHCSWKSEIILKLMDLRITVINKKKDKSKQKRKKQAKQ